MLHDTSGLFRLVYRSDSALPGSAREVREAVEAIVATSRRRNAEAGLTGALMFTGLLFVQALEGSAAAVEAAFERICCDLRHGAIEVMECGPVVERAFGNGAMSQVPMNAIASDAPAGTPLGEAEDESAVADAAITAMKLMVALSRSAPNPVAAAERAAAERRAGSST